MISSRLFIGGLFLLVGVSLKEMFSTGLSVQSMGDDQKGGVEEFRAMVENLDLPQKYMKDDAYLLRYLEANDFNLNAAFNHLSNVLEIRKAENFDNILEEDWSDHEKRLPYSLSSVNKEGRPVLYYPYGKWDISTEVASGDFEKFLRYSFKNLEEADRKVHLLREENIEISQFDIIVDFDGYALDKHGCLQCIQAYREVMKRTEVPFLGANKNVYFINTPSVFQAVYPWLASVFADEKVKERIHVLGGRSSFEPVLLQHIDADQLPNGILDQQE